MSGYSQRHSLGREAGQDVYRQIFKAEAKGLFVLEADASQCTVVDVNPAFEAFTGMAAVDCMGRSLRATDPPGQFIVEFAECMQCIATGDPLERDCQVRATGGVRTLRLRLTPLRDPGHPGRNVTPILGELRDLSESKRIAPGFYERAAQFQVLVESAPDFIGRYTVEGRWLYMNPALERASGFKLEDVRGRLISETMPNSATTRRLQAVLAEAVRTRAVVEVDLQSDSFIRGETMWHHVQMVPEFDGDGDVVSVIAIGRDITEKRRAAELARELAEQFRDLVERAPDAIARYDAEGRFQYINPALERLAGHTLDQVRGKLYEEVALTLPGAEQFFQTLREVTVHGTPLEAEFYIAPKSGDPVWHQLRFVPEFDQEQRVATVLVVGRDVTRIKRAEEQLRQRERDFRTLTENSPDVIARFDRDMRCLYMNQAVTKLTGIPAERFIGTIPGGLGPVHGTLHDADRLAKLQDACKRAFETGVVQKMELEMADQQVFDFQIVPERNSEGAITSLITIARDITEIRRSEAALKRLNAVLGERVAARTAELEAANRELEKFAYTVSHDLRAPLRVIHGFVHLLLEHDQARLTAEGRHMLEHIGNAGIKLGKLIEDILEYSRVGHARLQRQPVNMTALAQEVIESMSPTYPQSRATIGDLPQAFGDPTMLRQVLQNLVNNAFKFSARRSAPQIIVAAQEEQERLVYFVSDNGVGFDMQYADKLFDVFQRLHPERDYPGTGAGLAIVKRLVERHGGRIWAASTPDVGTTFYFTLQ